MKRWEVKLMQYKVTIENFDGPLDLLLHLIKEQDIDTLIKSRRRFVSRNKMKKWFISHIQQFL